MYERFIARQPIFDRRMNVFGYELLFRAGAGDGQCIPAEHATAHVIVDGSMLLRMETLVGTGKAFFNMTPEELRSGSAFLLSSSRTVIEIVGAPEGGDGVETVLACQNLREAGYQLAVDGFRDEPRWKPLLPFVSFLKIDFRNASLPQRNEIIKRFSGNGLKIIAKRIETRAQFDEAYRAGCSFFQGFFFLKPELIVARDLPASKLNALRLLRECAAPELRYADIEEILKQEPALLHKLLRYLNSAALGMAREVNSVPHAIALLGEKEFRRWVSVVAMVAAALDEPVEVLRAALVRAYFCERLSQMLELPRSGSRFFLMGLFSVLDVLFCRPLADILAELPLAEEIRTALLGGCNVFRDVYAAALAYEAADWPKFQEAGNRLRLNETFVPDQYEAAVRDASGIDHQRA